MPNTMKTSLPMGKRFENDMTTIVKRTYAKRGLVREVRITVGTDADYRKGTDLFVERIPVDLTTDFNGKDHTTELPSNGFRICGMDIRFGIRSGNAYGRFQTPVLVIGIDATPHYINQNYKSFMMAFQWQAGKIINAGLEQYRQALVCS